MMKQLQPFQRKSSVYKAIFDAEEVQLDNRDAVIADLKLQMAVDTATWALDIYEKDLKIPTDPNKPYSERRAVVKSKMRGTGQVDASLIKIVADSYTNGDVDVTFDGTINITFTSIYGIPPNEDDLKNAVEEIKPAHLPVDYLYLYIRYEQLTPYTHDQLATLTHEQLRTQLPA